MKTSKNIRTYAFYLLVIAVFGAGIYFGITQLQQNNTINGTNQIVSQEGAKDTSAEPVDYLTYTGIEGEDALTTLKATNDQVVTKTSDFGEYVDSINGLVGGTDGKYWSFYVNETLSDIGAGSYIAKGGETFEWKFIKLQ